MGLLTRVRAGLAAALYPLGRVAVTEVRPGDLLLYRPDPENEGTEREAWHFATSLREQFPGVQVAILEPGDEVQVLRGGARRDDAGES